MNPFLEGFLSTCKPLDKRAPWQWAEDNVTIDKTSPFAGRFRADTAPWTKELMEVWADNRVRSVSVMCSAQSSKTQTLMILLSWSIAEDAGPALWVMASQPEAQEFCRDRLWPTFDNCPKVAAMMPRDRSARKKTDLAFDSMPLSVTSAGSKSKLQSKPIRWLILDEVRNYPKGALELALKRTRAFWNSRTAIVSTPDMEQDAVHRAFLMGDQRRYFSACPACSHRFELRWECIKWDENETTRPAGGRWDFDALAPTIRVECPECKHRIEDRPQERQQLAEGGKWVRTNEAAPEDRVSFTWNALLPPWVSWRSCVEEFLNAQAALKWRNEEPLKAFINETLGEPWEDRMKETRDWQQILDRRGEFNLGDAWTDEKRRFLTIDVQKDHLWYLCRAWGNGGESRLVAFGRLSSLEELPAKAEELKVAADDVAIDSGWSADVVYTACVEMGEGRWKPMKGDRAPFFRVKNTRRAWTKTLVEVGIGTKRQGAARLYLYIHSNLATKDILGARMAGLSAGWQIARDAPQEYLDQVTAEERRERVDGKGQISYEWVKVKKDNHAFDLEAMQIVCALATGTIYQTDEPES